MKSLLNIEEHPLEPFLPANAKLLMLGSFPPQKKRWSMEFFIPICKMICGVFWNNIFPKQRALSES